MSLDQITSADFDATVMAADRPVVVDFWAPWCGPCSQIAPHLEALARDRQDIRVVKVNVDDAPELAARFGVRGIPALLAVRDGTVAGLRAGAGTRAQIESWLDTTLR